MSAPIRNADGTANMQGLKNEVTKLKGKYAQNAKNFEANTGKPMNIFESSAGGEQPPQPGQGQGEQEEEGQQPIRVLSHEERRAAAAAEVEGDAADGTK